MRNSQWNSQQNLYLERERAGSMYQQSRVKCIPEMLQLQSENSDCKLNLRWNPGLYDMKIYNLLPFSASISCIYEFWVDSLSRLKRKNKPLVSPLEMSYWISLINEFTKISTDLTLHMEYFWGFGFPLPLNYVYSLVPVELPLIYSRVTGRRSIPRWSTILHFFYAHASSAWAN